MKLTPNAYFLFGSTAATVRMKSDEAVKDHQELFATMSKFIRSTPQADGRSSFRSGFSLDDAEEFRAAYLEAWNLLSFESKVDVMAYELSGVVRATASVALASLSGTMESLGQETRRVLSREISECSIDRMDPVLFTFNLDIPHVDNHGRRQSQTSGSLMLVPHLIGSGDTAAHLPLGTNNGGIVPSMHLLQRREVKSESDNRDKTFQNINMLATRVGRPMRLSFVHRAGTGMNQHWRIEFNDVDAKSDRIFDVAPLLPGLKKDDGNSVSSGQYTTRGEVFDSRLAAWANA